MAASGIPWSYANNWRALSSFLGIAMVMLGVGMLSVSAFGIAAADGATLLLGLATFLTLFSLLLLFPRLHRRGVRNYTRVVDRPMDEVADVVRGALEAAGRSVRIDALSSRMKRTARLVKVEGATHFLLEPFAGPARSGENSQRTEIVQVSIAEESDEAAKALRDLIESRLSNMGDRMG